MTISVAAHDRGEQGKWAEISRLLPDGWSPQGKRVLDFHAEGEPPLPQPDGHFDLVCAISPFTRLADRWSEWLLELHRVLAPEGLLVATVFGKHLCERLTGEAWDEDAVGMNVLRRPDGPGAGDPVVLHSEWWIRAHWGRAFDVVALETDPEHDGGSGTETEPAGRTWTVLRRRPVELTSEELERDEPGEPREVRSLRHNVRQLLRQLDEVGTGAPAASRGELDALRESFHAELGRKSARIAQLERAAQAAGRGSTLRRRVGRSLREARGRISRARRA